MRTVTTRQVKQMQEEGKATLVNVLDEDHFREIHIPGSYNIPLERPDFESRIELAAGGKDAPVVVYCADAACSASRAAACRLEAAGFDDVCDYVGGTAAWRALGRAIEGHHHSYLSPEWSAAGS